MNTFISINSITLTILLKRYKFSLIGKYQIIKAAQKRYLTSTSFNRLARKIGFNLPSINKKL